VIRVSQSVAAEETVVIRDLFWSNNVGFSCEINDRHPDRSQLRSPGPGFGVQSCGALDSVKRQWGIGTVEEFDC
jgi:hypothetical protein